MARLARLVGRGRALEIVASADDYTGDLAAQYGYINRALPDDELDGFVNAFAIRLSSFQKSAIAEAKELVDVATLPPRDEFEASMKAYFRSATRPETRGRVGQAVEAGLQQRSEVELNLGRYVGEPAASGGRR